MSNQESNKDQIEKEQLFKRMNIIIQQRNSFLDQLVLLQEQLDTALARIAELEKSKDKKTNS